MLAIGMLVEELKSEKELMKCLQVIWVLCFIIDKCFFTTQEDY